MKPWTVLLLAALFAVPPADALFGNHFDDEWTTHGVAVNPRTGDVQRFVLLHGSVGSPPVFGFKLTFTDPVTNAVTQQVSWPGRAVCECPVADGCSFYAGITTVVNEPIYFAFEAAIVHRCDGAGPSVLAGQGSYGDYILSAGCVGCFGLPWPV